MKLYIGVNGIYRYQNGVYSGENATRNQGSSTGRKADADDYQEDAHKLADVRNLCKIRCENMIAIGEHSMVLVTRCNFEIVQYESDYCGSKKEYIRKRINGKNIGDAHGEHGNTACQKDGSQDLVYLLQM